MCANKDIDHKATFTLFLGVIIKLIFYQKTSESFVILWAILFWSAVCGLGV